MSDDAGGRQRGRGPSIQAVATRAGVSVATVSRVLNGIEARYSETTSRKVLAAVAELGYRPSSAGRALRRGESHVVVVLAANLANPAMAAMAASTEKALRAAGYLMALCDTQDEPAIQDEYILEARAQRAAAIVFLAAVESAGLAAVRRSGERLVFVNRRDPAPAGHPFVGIDNRAAGRDAAAHLLAAGCRRIGLIHGDPHSSATAERRDGVVERLVAETGVRLETVQGRAAHLELGATGACEILARMPDVDGLCCLSDLIAFGAARRLRDSGREVPRDVLVVGFDGAPLNAWVAPWLTSVHIPYDAFGPSILEALSEADRPNGREIVLPYDLARG